MELKAKMINAELLSTHLTDYNLRGSVISKVQDKVCAMRSIQKCVFFSERSNFIFDENLKAESQNLLMPKFVNQRDFKKVKILKIMNLRSPILASILLLLF